MNRLGLLRCALAAVLFGASAPAAAQLAGDMSAFSLAGLLYLGAALAVAPFARLPGRRTPRLVLARLGLAVVAGGAVAPVLLAVGLANAPSATVSLLLNLELVLTVTVAGVVFREHLGRPLVAGTAMVVLASVVLAGGGGADLRWGVLFVAGACLGWAVDNSITAGLDAVSPAQVTLSKGVVAGPVNLLVGTVVGGWPAWGDVAAAVAIGTVGYGLSITLWVSGARLVGAARGQLVFATGPFVGAVTAWAVFGEPVLGRQVAALAIAFGGVAFVFGSAHGHEHEHPTFTHDGEHGHPDGHHDHTHDPPVRRHSHPHEHRAVRHAHPHVPDVHHRHRDD